VNHILAAMLVADHLNDLLREANDERRSALVNGARRSPWSAFAGRLAGLVGRPARATRRATPTTTSTGAHPATA